MVCQKCKNSGVLNTANHKDFWYCRTCKEEILLESKQDEQVDWTEVNRLFEEWNHDPSVPITLDDLDSSTMITYCSHGITLDEAQAKLDRDMKDVNWAGKGHPVTCTCEVCYDLVFEQEYK